MSIELAQRKILDIGFLPSFIIISSVTLLIYYPSFSHLLRGETYVYFLNTLGDTSILPLIANYYNYEMVRVYEPGDTWLFRPLLFTLLAIEKGLFGAHHLYWRIVALVLHIGAAGCLLRLLRKINPGIFALLVTLLFSVAYVSIDTILYEHVNAYLLFASLVLTALYYLYKSVEERLMKLSNLFIILGCMLIASFLYEVGVFFMILFIGYLWFERKRARNWKLWGLALSLSVLFWLAIYLGQKLGHGGDAALAVQNLVSLQAIANGIMSIPIVIKAWIAPFVLPALFELRPVANLFSPPSQIISTAWLSPLANINYLALIALSALALERAFTKKNRGLFLLLVGMTISYVAILSVARVETHGILYIISRLHAPYVFLASFVILIYSLVDFEKLGAAWKGYLKYCTVVPLLVLIYLNASQVFIQNQRIAEMHQPVRSYLVAIERFVDSRSAEQDFSFVTTLEHPMRKNSEFSTWTIESKNHYFSIPQIFYWEYYDKDNPKYTLQFFPESNKLVVEKLR